MSQDFPPNVNVAVVQAAYGVIQAAREFKRSYPDAIFDEDLMRKIDHGLIDAVQRYEDVQPKAGEPHSFAGDGHDCELCGGGRAHHLHAERAP